MLISYIKILYDLFKPQLEWKEAVSVQHLYLSLLQCRLVCVCWGGGGGGVVLLIKVQTGCI